jgi:histone H3/H4
MHKSKREKAIRGTGAPARRPLWVSLRKNETSRVRARVVHSLDKATLQKEIRNVVVPKSTVNTDAWGAYSGLSKNFQHEVIDHAVEYVRGQVHTNGLETFGAS